MKQNLFKRTMRAFACVALAATMTITIVGCDKNAAKDAASSVASSVVDDVKSEVESAVEGAKTNVSEAVEDARSDASKAVEDAKADVSEALEEASEAVESFADEAKGAKESLESAAASVAEDVKEAKEDVESAAESFASEVKERVQGVVEKIGKGATKFYFDVVDADGVEKLFEVATDKKMVGEALLEVKLIDGDDSAYGLYVKTVNGVTVDYDKDGAYWAFYVNGEYASTGVDATEIKAGTTYTFKVEK